MTIRRIKPPPGRELSLSHLKPPTPLSIGIFHRKQPTGDNAPCRLVKNFERRRPNVLRGQSARRISSISGSSQISRSNGWPLPSKLRPAPRLILQHCHLSDSGNPAGAFLAARCDFSPPKTHQR